MIVPNITPRTDADRDAFGKFAEGCSPGPGRPRKATEEKYAAAFRRGCPPSELVIIIKKLAEKAKKGDVSAATLLLKHAIPARVEIEDNTRQLRAAGMSPDSINRQMLDRVTRKIREQAERERELEAEAN